MDPDRVWNLVLARLRQHFNQQANMDLIEHLTYVDKAQIGLWLQNEQPAKGRILQLWHILEAAGYHSPEMEELSPLQRFIGKLHAFRIVEMPDLVKLLMFWAPSGVEDYILGVASTSADEGALFAELVEQHTVALGSMLLKARRYMVNLFDTPDTPLTESVEDPTFAVANVSDPALAAATAAGILLPLLRFLWLRGTLDQRLAFGRMTEGQIGPLLAMLEALHGETRGRSAAANWSAF